MPATQYPFLWECIVVPTCCTYAIKYKLQNLDGFVEVFSSNATQVGSHRTNKVKPFTILWEVQVTVLVKYTHQSLRSAMLLIQYKLDKLYVLLSAE